MIAATASCIPPRPRSWRPVDWRNLYADPWDSNKSSDQALVRLLRERRAKQEKK